MIVRLPFLFVRVRSRLRFGLVEMGQQLFSIFWRKFKADTHRRIVPIQARKNLEHAVKIDFLHVEPQIENYCGQVSILRGRLVANGVKQRPAGSTEIIERESAFTINREKRIEDFTGRSLATVIRAYKN